MNEAYDLAYYKIELANLAIKNKIPLIHWMRGVSIILEKKQGNISVEKLRAMLLLKTD